MENRDNFFRNTWHDCNARSANVSQVDIKASHIKAFACRECSAPGQTQADLTIALTRLQFWGIQIKAEVEHLGGLDQAQQVLFNSIKAKVRRHIQAKLGAGNEDWKDIFQATMIDVLRSFEDGKFQPERGSFGGFVYGITKNKIAEYYAGEAKRRKSQISLDGNLSSKYRELILQQSQRFFQEVNDEDLILTESMQHLPEKYRVVLHLRYFRELSMREIGEEIGRTEQQVIDLHRYALKKLRAHLERE